MSAPKFTPGPWSQQREGTPFARNRVWPTTGSMPICSLLSHGSLPADLDPIAQANGRLIAATPDLYEALKPFVAAFRAAREAHARRHGGRLELGRQRFDAMPGSWPMDHLIFTMEDFREADAALSKAEGQQ